MGLVEYEKCSVHSNDTTFDPLIESPSTGMAHSIIDSHNRITWNRPEGSKLDEYEFFNPTMAGVAILLKCVRVGMVHNGTLANTLSKRVKLSDSGIGLIVELGVFCYVLTRVVLPRFQLIRLHLQETRAWIHGPCIHQIRSQRFIIMRSLPRPLTPVAALRVER